MKKSFIKSFFSLLLVFSFTLNSFAATVYSPGTNASSKPSPLMSPTSQEEELTPLSNASPTLRQDVVDKISQLVINDGTPVIKAPGNDTSAPNAQITISTDGGLLNSNTNNGPIASIESAGPAHTDKTIDINTNTNPVNIPSVDMPANSLFDLPTNYQQVEIKTPVPNISAPAYIIVNATTKQIYASKDQDALYEPAGLTNLMTAYLGTLYKKLDDTLTCSYDAWHTVDADAYIAGLTSGDKITLKDAIASMFVRSCADSANVVAEAVSGKISTFIDIMNTTAKVFGCQNTNFTNASGLNNDNQKSTAYDLMLIMDKVTENPELVNLLSLSQYTLPEAKKRDKLILFSKNSALVKNGANYNADITCSRLGYTSKSGYTMASMCNYQGNRFIAIILKAKGSQFEDTKKLINFAKLCYEETK